MSKLGDEDARCRMAENPGGAMFELGCHLIDALVTMLGPPTHVTPLLRATRGDGLFDNCLATFEYPDALATVSSSLVEPHGQERRHFTVSGENGTIEILPLETPKIHLTLQQARDKFRPGSSVVPQGKRMKCVSIDYLEGGCLSEG
jgi:predicted dehydrogenase